MIEAALIYLAGIVVMAGSFAIRTPDQDLRTVFLLSLFWPASLIFVLFIGALWAVNWDFDIAQGTKMFGFRKPGNTEVTGFAVSVFTAELQFWKKRQQNG
jgi:hypothetical protein